MVKVAITVDTQGPGDNGGTFSKKYYGEYYQRGEYHYIIYKDVDKETKAETKTMLKYKDDFLGVTRSGSLQHQQEFQRGMKGKSTYATPFGTLAMSHITKELSIEKKIKTKIKVSYDLYINDVEQGAMEIEIKIAPLH